MPNLQVSSPYGKTQPNFSLRGVSVANEFNANQASPNGVYLDEVYLSARFAQGMNLFDLERVEVVKGPQGTLYGRNTVGGAINIITRKAEFAPLNGFVEGGYGNFNRWSLTGAAGGTLVEDRLAFRIAGTVEKGDGQLKNLFPGNPDERSVDNYAIRGSAVEADGRPVLAGASLYRRKQSDRRTALRDRFGSRRREPDHRLFAAQGYGLLRDRDQLCRS